MPVRVKVRAVIWVDGHVVVNRVARNGRPHVSLPGGRVHERESVLDALRREVLEEVGLDVEPGELLCAAEVLSGARRQDIELIFAASVRGEIDPGRLDLVDPGAPEARGVLPPVLGELGSDRAGRWLGNLYEAR